VSNKTGGQCQWSGCSQPAVATTRWPNGANARHCQEHHDIVLEALSPAVKSVLAVRAEATRAMPSLAAYDALVTDLLAEAETRLAETAPIDRRETMDAGGTSAATEYHDCRAVRVASPNRAALGVYGGTSSDG
jgi:hypothetical protein